MRREPSSKELAERRRRADEAEARLMQPILRTEPMPREDTLALPEPAKGRAAAAKKAWETRRQIRAVAAAQKTDKWTEILCRALTARVVDRWHLVSFRGKNGGEWYGVVDVLAIRKDTSRPANAALRRCDLFEMILVQMKGGSARNPGAGDLQRLRAVKEHYGAKEIVLFRWIKGRESTFSKLSADNTWKGCSAKAIFG